MMKKIMFNDRYGLTQAVLDGRKTMTRRIITKDIPLGSWKETEAKAPFKIGEIVAIAQSYRSLYRNPLQIPACVGWFNKMFVRADLMPHQIRITNLCVERLQDISDEDCIKEGIVKWTKDGELFKYDLSDGFEIFKWMDKPRTPRSAYAALIDKLLGRDAWNGNPFVFAYEFELVK